MINNFFIQSAKMIIVIVLMDTSVNMNTHTHLILCILTGKDPNKKIIYLKSNFYSIKNDIRLIK